MRQANTYRGARRNAARDAGLLGVWRDDPQGAAALANLRAKLPQRRQICAAAREVAAQAAAGAHITGQNPAKLVLDALRVFWAKQPNTRVVSRIRKELAA